MCASPVSTPAAAAGRAPPRVKKTSLPGGGGRRPPSQAPPLAAALQALQRTPELPPLLEVAGAQRRSREQKIWLCEPTQRGRTATSMSTCSCCLGHVPGAPLAATSRGTGQSSLVPGGMEQRGSKHPAVAGQPQWSQHLGWNLPGSSHPSYR